MNDLVSNTCAFNGPSFSLRNRLRRVLWNAVYLLLFRFTPRPCHAWRAFVLRLFGARLGARCHIYPRVVVWAPWNLHCGDEVGVGDGAILYNLAAITLGNRVVVSQGAHLCTGSHDYSSPHFEVLTGPILVQEQAWLAAECFVLPGVTIGAGAVIAARAVVTRSMPEWMVCAGHPCAPIKARVLKTDAQAAWKRSA